MKVLYDDINISVGETGIESAPPGYLGVLAGDRGFYAMSGREVVPLSAISRCVIGATGSLLTGDPESLLVNNGVTATVLLRNECYTIVDNPPGIPLTFLVEPKAGSSRCTWLRMTTGFPRMAHLPKGLLWTSKAGEPAIPRSMPFEVAVYDDMARFAVYDKESFTLHCIDELEVSMLCGDGTDGKGGVYTLSAIMVSGVVRNGVCSWSSSDESIATVVNGEVRAAEGAAGSVEITATSGGISSSCRVTVYSTLPDVDDRYRLPGGSGVTGPAGGSIVFERHKPVRMNYLDVDMAYVPTGSSSSIQAFEVHADDNAAVRQVIAMPLMSGSSLLFHTVAYASSNSAFAASVYSQSVGHVVGSPVRARFMTSNLHPTLLTYNGKGYGATGTPVDYTDVNFGWEANSARLVFSNNSTIKMVHAAGYASEEAPNEFTWRTSDLMYTPQNYILYRNRSAGGVLRSNYTVIPNAGTLGRAYDLSANYVPAGWFASNAPEFLCVDEAEVSMLCVDGTDGKDGEYQLHAVFTGDSVLSTWVTWSSSDHSVATVSSSGLVTAVSNGGAPLGKDVTITATYEGKTSSCLFTVYETMPTETARYYLKGGCGGDSYADPNGPTTAMFTSTKPLTRAQVSMRLSEQSWAIASETGTCGADSTLFGFYRFSFNTLPIEGGSFRGYEISGASKYQTQFGPNKGLNTKSRHAFGYGSSGYFADGTTFARVAIASGWGPLQNLIFMRTRSNTDKLATFSTSGAARSESQLENPTLCDLWYSQQNYIRWTNRYVNGVSRINFTTIPNIGTLGATYDLSANNVPAGWFASNAPEFLCVDEAEVSMLCVDGTDGKDGGYQLHAVFTGDSVLNTWVTWSSSDHSVATVSSSGLVTAVSNGGAALGKDVTITATYGGLSYSCLVTVYQTMPSADVDGEGLWLCKGGKGYGLGSAYAGTVVFAGQVPPGGLPSSRLISSYVVPPDGAYSQHLKNGVSSSYINPSYGDSAAYYSPLLAVMVGTTEYQYKTAYPQSLGSAYTTDISYDSSTVRVNGAPVAKTLVQTTTRSVGFFDQDWHQATRKVVLSAYASEAEVPSFASAIALVPQNYIRYTDRTSSDGTVHVNSTVIPNIGTLGSAYNLSANNVPAVWFGV